LAREGKSGVGEVFVSPAVNGKREEKRMRKLVMVYGRPGGVARKRKEKSQGAFLKRHLLGGREKKGGYKGFDQEGGGKKKRGALQHDLPGRGKETRLFDRDVGRKGKGGRRIEVKFPSDREGNTAKKKGGPHRNSSLPFSFQKEGKALADKGKRDVALHFRRTEGGGNKDEEKKKMSAPSFIQLREREENDVCQASKEKKKESPDLDPLLPTLCEGGTGGCWCYEPKEIRKK